jgi:hypothetical protein
MVLAAIKSNPKSNRIAFLATWRNAHANHHFAPYPGHKEAADSMAFHDAPNTIFLNDVPELYYALLKDDVPTSIHRELNRTIELYPNPSSEVVMIRGQENILSIDIINSAGQVVRTIDNLNDNFAEVDVQSLPRGVYTIRITVGVRTRAAKGKYTGKVYKD